MSELKKVKDMVEIILKDTPQARNDDYILIKEVYRRFCGVTDKNGFFEVMTLHRGLPSFESITRSRRKLQAEMPLVYGSNGAVRKMRIYMECEYIDEFAEKH